MCDIKKFWRLHYSEVVRSGGITTMLHTTLDDAKEEQRRLITGGNIYLPITLRPVFVIVDDDGQIYEINTCTGTGSPFSMAYPQKPVNISNKTCLGHMDFYISATRGEKRSKNYIELI